jgi:uncharacterized protein with HEPN domain
MITAPMLNLIQEAGEAVLVLTDEVEQAEFLRSRLTREEVRRQLRTLADTLANLPEAAQQVIAEIDWAGWRATRSVLDGPGAALDEAIWFAARALTPATLSWLRFYRVSNPELFSWTDKV